MKRTNTLQLAEAWGAGAPQLQDLRRVPHALLLAEPDIADLAARCIDAAGSWHSTEPASVNSRLLSMACAQVQNWFTALRRPAEAATVVAMASGDGFTAQMLWDFLTGDPGKIAVHNRLVQLLDSELVEQIVIGSIRQGFHTPDSEPRAN